MAKKNNANNTNTLPEQEFNFIVSDVRIPRMVPLQTLADESGISYKALWQMCKQNKIVHIKSGNKFLVNMGNQRIIAGNAQFTGIAAGRGVGFTTGLLLLREGLGMRETPIRPHSWH